MTDASLAIQEYILSRLKAEPRLASLSAADQIRTASDQSDPAVGDAAIVVACSDLGNHLGIPGRIAQDAMFRYQEFSATILLQSDPSTHQENQPQP